MKHWLASIIAGFVFAGLTVLIGRAIGNMSWGFIISFVLVAVFIFYLFWRWEVAQERN